MTREEDLQKSLIKKFNVLEGKFNMPRARRIFVQVPREKMLNVVEYALKELKFTMLLTITGLDVGEEIQIIYHLASMEGIMLNLQVNVPKSDPVVKTVTGYYNGATLYEREIVDILGVKVEGLPPGHRYPLHEGWPEGQYPLRKDWKADTLQKSETGGK